MKIRVVIADDHPALLAGIKHELSSIATLDVVGQAQDSGELSRVLKSAACDVLVTDYAMPGGQLGDGMAMLTYLRRTYPELKLIVFTTMDNRAIVQELAKLGVNGVLNKANDTTFLVSAIHAVHAGATYFRHDLVGHPNIEAAPPASGKTALSKRELEVVRLFVSGLTITEIAEQLHRTKQTISTQKANAMRKLGITRDSDLFLLAFESGSGATEGPAS